MSYIHPGGLSSFFNPLPRHSTLRFPVYKTLVELASSNDELYILQVSRSDVESWLKEYTGKRRIPEDTSRRVLKSESAVRPISSFPVCAYSTIHFLNRAETWPITANP